MDISSGGGEVLQQKSQLDRYLAVAVGFDAVVVVVVVLDVNICQVWIIYDNSNRDSNNNGECNSVGILFAQIFCK